MRVSFIFLSRDLRKISNLTESYDQYNGYALEKAISLIIDERLVSKGLQFVSISFNADDVWYLMTARVEDNGRASGIVKEMFNATMYSMWRWEGADAVLKKLGEQPASSGKLIKQFYGIGTGQGAEGYVTNTYQISQSDKNSNYKCYILNVSTAYIDMVTWEGCEISISNGGKKISEAVYDGISVSNGSLGSVRGMRLKTFVWMLPGDAPVGSTFTIRARGIFIGQIIGIQ